MIQYNNSQELSDALYEAFLGKVGQSGIYPTPETVSRVQQLIQIGINNAITSGDLPVNYSDDNVLPPNLQETVNNTERLADEMILQARQKDSIALLAFSWQEIKNALCPLFPFFPPPCN